MTWFSNMGHENLSQTNLNPPPSCTNFLIIFNIFCITYNFLQQSICLMLSKNANRSILMAFTPYILKISDEKIPITPALVSENPPLAETLWWTLDGGFDFVCWWGTFFKKLQRWRELRMKLINKVNDVLFKQLKAIGGSG